MMNEFMTKEAMKMTVLEMDQMMAAMEDTFTEMEYQQFEDVMNEGWLENKIEALGNPDDEDY